MEQMKEEVLFRKLLYLIIWLIERLYGPICFPILNIPEIKIMFTVKDDQPNVPYSFAPITGATDAEGSPIPASEFNQTDLVSDNPSAVDAVDGQLVFGSPNADGSPAIANLTSDIEWNGIVVATRQYSFTVTHGDPVNVIGGGATFEGLEEDQEVPAPEPGPEPAPVPEPVTEAPEAEAAPEEPAPIPEPENPVE